MAKFRKVKAFVEDASRLAEALGFDLAFFSSEVKNGRYTGANGKYLDGKIWLTQAMLGINNPLLSIGSQTANQNPAVIMALPVFENGSPLEAILSFYSNKSINGSFERKPHVVLSIYQRAANAQNGFEGWDTIIDRAIKEKRLLDVDTNKRSDLSVIAQENGLGNVAEASLKNNLSQFQKEINTFKGTINIKNIKRGKLFHDITKIENITQAIIGSYGVNPQANFLRDVSMDSIRDDSKNVKPAGQNSDRGTEYLELAKDPEKNRERLQEMVDEAAKAAGAKTFKNGKVRHYYHGTTKAFTSFAYEKARRGNITQVLQARCSINWQTKSPHPRSPAQLCVDVSCSWR